MQASLTARRGGRLVGMLPLALSGSSLWPPLAWAMISGLLASTLLTILVVLASLPHMLGGVPLPFLPAWFTSPWTQLILSTPVLFWCGREFFTAAASAFRQHSADMNTLVAVGSLSAYLYSSLVTFLPDIFVSAEVAPHVYFDGAAMIVTLILLGRLLEAKTKGKTSAAIKRLMGRGVDRKRFNPSKRDPTFWKRRGSDNASWPTCAGLLPPAAGPNRWRCRMPPTSASPPRRWPPTPSRAAPVRSTRK